MSDTAKPKSKVGRPSKYKPEYDKQAGKLCALGATDRELADFFEVDEKTINTWKDKHPSFLQSLRDAKEELDSRVERRLFERAMGYSHPEDDIRTVSCGQGQGSEIIITPTTKHYPPDTTAAIFWLKNRRKEQWRDKLEHEHSGELVVKVTKYGSSDTE